MERSHMQQAGHPLLAPLPRKQKPTSQWSSLHHTEEEWTAMYPHIQRLYEDERCKLRELKTRMELEHGFRATDMMYKKRFAKWAIGKKSKHQINSHRSSPSEEECEKGGRLPANSLQCQSKLRNAAVYVRSSLTTLQPSIPPFHTALCSSLWSIQHWNMENTSIGAKPGETRDLCPVQSSSTTMYQTFVLATNLFARGHGALAGRAVRKMFVLLEHAIADKTPVLMWNIVDVMHGIAAQGQNALLVLFLGHIKELAASKLPIYHPLAEIVTHTLRIHKMSLDWLTKAISIVRQCNFDFLYKSAAVHGFASHKRLFWEGCQSRLGPCPDPKRDAFVVASWIQSTKGDDTPGVKGIRSVLFDREGIPLASDSEVKKMAADFLETKVSDSSFVKLGDLPLDSRKLLAQIEMNSEGHVVTPSTSASETPPSPVSDPFSGQATPKAIWETWYVANYLQMVGLDRDAARSEQMAMSLAQAYLKDIPTDDAG